MSVSVKPLGTMEILDDFERRSIRLTDERKNHILEHPEMEEMIGFISETLQAPLNVVQSLSDPEARLYYRKYPNTGVGKKFLCVLVKVKPNDAFVLTAYLTDTIKKGEILWPRS